MLYQQFMNLSADLWFHVIDEKQSKITEKYSI